METFRDKKHKSFLFSTKSFPMLKVKIVIFPKIFRRKYSQDIEVVNTALGLGWVLESYPKKGERTEGHNFVSFAKNSLIL